MVEIVGSPISRPASARLAAIAAVAVATAAAGFALPRLGVPPALGLVGYLAIRLSKPNPMPRRRTLSAAQHRRAAIIVGSLVFAGAALFSATLAGLDLAGRLQSQLYQRIARAEDAGDLKLGETLQQCEEFACARATIVELATARSLGLAKLRGFAVDDLHAYGWRPPISPLYRETAQ
jgi:hypothetical protein